MAAWIVLSAALAAGPQPAIVQECPDGGVAAVSLVVGMDPTDVPAAKRGLAAVFAETLLQQMSAALEKPEPEAVSLRRHLPPNRGIDIFTEAQYLAVTVNCAAEAADAALDFLIDTVISSNPSQKALEISKRAVLVRKDEWARSLVQPTQELFLRALYVGLPPDFGYGTTDTIRKIRLQDMLALRKKLLVRSNVRLSAVVPSGGEELLAKMEKAIAKLEQGGRCRRPHFFGEPRVVVRDNPAIKRASLIVGGPLAQPGDRLYWAGLVAREILAGPDGTIVRSRDLTRRLGLLIPRSMDWHAWPVQVLQVPIAPAPYLAIHAVCHPARIELVRKGIIAHLKRIAEGDFTDRQLERAKERAVNTWANRTMPHRDRARLIAVLSLVGRSLPDADEVYGLVQGISRDEVAQAARGVLDGLAIGLQMPRS